MVTQNSVMHLLIGKKISVTSNVQAIDPTAASYLADGEIVVTSVDGTVLDTTTVLDVDRVVIVQGQGSTKPVIKSDVIYKSNVKTLTKKAYTAPTVQVDYIGYDATADSGSIEVLDENGYEVMISDRNSSNYGSNGIDKFGFYVSDASATQEEVATNMTKSLINNFSRVTYKPFYVERVNSGTQTVLGTGVNDITFTKGSTTISCTGAIDNTTGGATALAAGVWIAVGTDAEAAVYKIVSINTTDETAELDIAFQAASVTLADTLVTQIIAANVGDFGIRLTGLAPTFNGPEENEYYVNRWTTTLRNFGSTTVTTTEDATEGSGAYAQISTLEYFLQGNEGFISRHDMPHKNARANAESTGTYDVYALEYSFKPFGSVMEAPTSHKQLLVAYNVTGGAGTNQSSATVGMEAVLEAWLDVTL